MRVSLNGLPSCANSWADLTKGARFRMGRPRRPATRVGWHRSNLGTASRAVRDRSAAADPWLARKPRRAIPPPRTALKACALASGPPAHSRDDRATAVRRSCARRVQGLVAPVRTRGVHGTFGRGPPNLDAPLPRGRGASSALHAVAEALQRGAAGEAALPTQRRRSSSSCGGMRPRPSRSSRSPTRCSSSTLSAACKASRRNPSTDDVKSRSGGAQAQRTQPASLHGTAADAGAAAFEGESESADALAKSAASRLCRSRWRRSCEGRRRCAGLRPLGRAGVWRLPGRLLACIGASKAVGDEAQRDGGDAEAWDTSEASAAPRPFVPSPLVPATAAATLGAAEMTSGVQEREPAAAVADSAQAAAATRPPNLATATRAAASRMVGTLARGR